jgi:phage N-6-adenine-methyltransferase
LAQALELFAKDDWETPWDKLHDAFQNFQLWPELDVCATRQNRKCKYFITKEQDCFKADIRQDFFMNPPYSKCGLFMDWAVSTAKQNKLNCIILIYAGADTAWWHRLVGHKMQYVTDFYFERGKIYFLRNGQRMNDLASKGRARAPNVWLCYKYGNRVR